MAQQVITVSQINEYIRTMLDGDRLLSNLAIKGEISNYKLYPSGHHYFTLKDAGGSLRCVMFKGSAGRMRFRPENGMQVIAMGKISVFPRDGAYQLYCTALVPDGVGDLYAAFEQLKAKLQAQGMFDPAHKKPIPIYPSTIGIITSSAGAAVHDMLRILHKRYPLTKVRLLPVRVQGVEAPGEIASAIRYANYYGLADLLIVGRGGGSLEDLWAFNDELVARAVYDSRIPVISAVGHEPDVTISDFVADLRAATPSNAAELAVPDQDVLRQTLDGYSATIASALQGRLRNARRHLQVLSDSPALQSPQGYLEQRKKALQMLEKRLLSAQLQMNNRKKQKFIALTSKLDAMSPLKVLTRGYSLVHSGEGTLIRSVRNVSVNDSVRIDLADGQFMATVTQVKEHQYESEE